MSEVYHVQEGRNTFTVCASLPPPGDALCMALTGCTEAELVRRILAGEYDEVITTEGGGAVGTGGLSEPT